jgi:hypothetical protein
VAGCTNSPKRACEDQSACRKSSNGIGIYLEYELLLFVSRSHCKGRIIFSGIRALPAAKEAKLSCRAWPELIVGGRHFVILLAGHCTSTISTIRRPPAHCWYLFQQTKCIIKTAEPLSLLSSCCIGKGPATRETPPFRHSYLTHDSINLICLSS